MALPWRVVLSTLFALGGILPVHGLVRRQFSNSFPNSTISQLSLSSSSTISSTSSSVDDGSIILQGLAPVSSPTPSIPPTQPIAVGLVTIDGTIFTATKLENGEILVDGTTVWPDGYTSVPSWNRTEPVATGTITENGGPVTLTELADGDVLFNGITVKADPTQPVAEVLVNINGTNFTATRLADGDILVDNLTILPSGVSVTSQTITNTTNRSSSAGIPKITTTSIITPFANSTITTAPSTPNATVTVPSGFGVLGNATFRTSCSFGDFACFSTCTSLADICSESWAPYDAELQEFEGMNVGGSWVTLGTATQTVDVTSTSYVLSASTEISQVTLPIATVTNSYFSLIDSCYSTTVLTTPYTITKVFNTCPQSDQEAPETDIYTQTPTTYDLSDVFTYAVSTIGVFVTQTVITTTISTFISATSLPSFPLTAPTCLPQAPAFCSFGANCNACTIFGGTVQLLYWPETTTPPLPSNATVTTAPVTEPAVAVVDGVNITSPSVGISFATAFALNDCNTTVGQPHTGSILVLAPSDVSSALANYNDLIYSPGSGTASALNSMVEEQFNFANLNWPYNGAAYQQQPDCIDYAFVIPECMVIKSGSYNPLLAVPTQIRSLDPAWATCAVDWEGLYDPPTALVPVSFLTPTTAPNSGSTGSGAAAPAPTPTPPAANPTAGDPAAPQGTNGAGLPASTGVAGVSTIGFSIPTPTNTAGDPSDPSASDPGAVGSSNGAGDPGASNSEGDPGASSGAGDAGTSSGAGDAGTSSGAGDPGASNGDGDPGASNGGGDAGGAPNGASDPSVPFVPGVVPGETPGVVPGVTPGVRPGTPTLGGDPPAADPTTAVIAVGGSMITAFQGSNGASTAVVGGATLTVGGSALSTDGVALTLGSNGLLIVSSGITSTAAFSNAMGATASTFVVGGSTITAFQGSKGASTAVVDDATLTVGGSALTTNGVTLTLGSNGLLVVSSGITGTAAFSNAIGAAASATAVFSIGGTVYTAVEDTAGASTAVMDGVTLSVGGPAQTINGETVSLGTAGMLIISDGVTSTAHFANGAAQNTASAEAVFEIGGSTFTAFEATAGASVAVVDGATLSVGGPATTIDGQQVSLGTAGIVVGTSTGGTGTGSTGTGTTMDSSILAGSTGSTTASTTATTSHKGDAPVLSTGLQRLTLVWVLVIAVAVAV